VSFFSTKSLCFDTNNIKSPDYHIQSLLSFKEWIQKGYMAQTLSKSAHPVYNGVK